MTYLLDTNVISELRKPLGKADPSVLAWADAHEPLDLYVSAITIFELELGVLAKARKDPVQGAQLRTWMEDRVKRFFYGRILPLDSAIAVEAARCSVPDRMPLADSFIAATARVHGLTIVTRDEKDYRRLDVPLVNPWLTKPPGS